jgi:Ca-activated chloride channel homolog
VSGHLAHEKGKGLCVFENSGVLGLLLALPLLLGLFYWRMRVGEKVLQRIGERLSSQVSRPRRFWKLGLWTAAAVALIFSLARPIWGVDAEVVETRGIAVMMVLDVSASMDAQDILPSRLERAKTAIRELMIGAEGNLFGLVLFAGDAFVQFPLTSDIDSALAFVDAASSTSISRQGTVIEDALRLAVATFDDRISSSSMIVLMTDGENHEGNPVAIAESAGVTIHVIGYGTLEGDLIPVYDGEGNLIEYKTDRGNNLIVTKLDEPVLQEIAEATGGLYQRATTSGVEVVNLQNRIAEVEGDLLATRFQTRPVERFGVFLALALIALTAEMVIKEQRVSV